MFRIRCGGCGQVLECDDDLRGTVVECSSCYAAMQLPAADAAPAAPARSRPASRRGAAVAREPASRTRTRRGAGRGGHRRSTSPSPAVWLLGGAGALVLVLGVLFLAGALGGGPHSSPEAVFEASRDAFIAGDWGRIWDLTAPSLRADMEGKFSSQKLMLEHDPAQKKLMLAKIGVPPGEFQRMSARDLFVRMMQRGFSAGGGFGGELARLRDEMEDAEVESVEIDGDQAVVRVTYGGRKDRIRVVREYGDWYLRTSF